MKPSFFGPDGGPPVTGAALSEILDELCERRASLQLATPYLAFPAHALKRCGEEFHLRVNLSRDFVDRTLLPQPLRIRFPWGLGMAGGPVKVLGFVQEGAKRLLRVQVPQELLDEDRRASVRLEPPNPGTATLSPDGETLVKARVDDISPLGVRVFALEPLNAAFVDNHTLQLSLNLHLGPHLDIPARLVRQEGQTLGLAFQPGLSSALRLELEAYLLPELEEAQRRWENRAAIRAARLKSLAPPEGVLLLGRDRILEADLRRALPQSLKLRFTPPALAPLLDALMTPPGLILLHVAKGGLEERFLVKALAEAFPPETPLVILGAPGFHEGRALAAELKAATYVEWNPAQALFFSRLLQGLLRKRWGISEE